MNRSYKNYLEAYINQYLDLWDFFGVIRVIKSGKVIYEKNSGYACLEFSVKNSMDTRFSLASMSKQFTAFSIMILQDKKLIDIDSPANLYLPDDIKIFDNITVQHLLSHTSGLYNFYNFENDFFGDKNRLTYSQREFLIIISVKSQRKVPVLFMITTIQTIIYLPGLSKTFPE